jgi:hypothetical protein
MTSQHQTITSVEERSQNREPLEEADEEYLAEIVEDVPTTRAYVTEASAAASNAELETPYLADQNPAQMSERWQRIQYKFVDDPRKTVGEAHQLVSELMQRIVDAFAQERGDLERQWLEGESVSTEDLRICLQRYRAFFSRLLPSVNDLETLVQSK